MRKPFKIEKKKFYFKENPNCSIEYHKNEKAF